MKLLIKGGNYCANCAEEFPAIVTVVGVGIVRPGHMHLLSVTDNILCPRCGVATSVEALDGEVEILYETNYRCNRCNSPVYKSSTPGYVYQCTECDEDLYGFEAYLPMCPTTLATAKRKARKTPCAEFPVKKGEKVFPTTSGPGYYCLTQEGDTVFYSMDDGGTYSMMRGGVSIDFISSALGHPETEATDPFAFAHDCEFFFEDAEETLEGGMIVPFRSGSMHLPETRLGFEGHYWEAVSIVFPNVDIFSDGAEAPYATWLSSDMETEGTTTLLKEERKAFYDALNAYLTTKGIDPLCDMAYLNNALFNYSVYSSLRAVNEKED